MTKIIDIPGGTATFKDDDQLSNRQTKTLTRIYRKAIATTAGLIELGWDATKPETWIDKLSMINDVEDTFEDYQHQAVLIKLIEWSLDRPIPTTAEELLDEDPKTYEALIVEATGAGPGEAPTTIDVVERPDFSLDAVMDPKADTSSSEESDSLPKD